MYTVWIYAERSTHKSLAAALNKAKRADARWARGFVQVIDPDGFMIWGTKS